MEHRMRCKVCGKIWCFTDKDLKDNQSNSLMSGLAAIGGIASALGGTTAQQHLNYDIMERNHAKVVDYHQCPNCRSKDVVELSEEEWSEVQLQERFANTRVSINANATTEALLDRIKLLLEDKDWPNANAYCDAVLDTEPQNAMAYVYKLMAELRVSEQTDLMNQKAPFDTKSNYQKALRFADGGLQQALKSYIVHINERNEQERLKGLYDNACVVMQQSVTEEDYQSAAALFAAIKGYKDADNLQKECLKKAEQARLDAERKAAEEKATAAEQAKKTKKIAMIVAPIVVVTIVAAVLITNSLKQSNAYNAAVALAEAGQYDEAIAAFGKLGDYKDSAEQMKETTYNQAVALLQVRKYDEALSIFTELGDYKDSADIAQQLPHETDVYNDAIRAFEAGDFETAKAAIESNKYVTLNPSIVSCIDFVTPYIGNWTFLSGDAQLITTVEHWDGECHSLATAFSGSSNFGVEGTIVLSYSWDISDSQTATAQMEFEVDFSGKSIEQSIRTGNSNYDGRLCIELTPKE